MTLSGEQCSVNPLAQLLILAQVDPAPGWRDFFDRYALEHPVLGALAILLAGLIVSEVFRRRGSGRGWILSLAASVVIGAGVVALGTWIETPREHLMKLTNRFLKGVEKADAASVGDLLADQVTLRTAGRLKMNLGREWLLGVVRGLDGVFKSHSVEVTEAMVGNPSAGTTQFISRAEFTNEPYGMVASSWELTWRKTGADWRLTHIECLTIFGKSANDEWVAWGNKHRR